MHLSNQILLISLSFLLIACSRDDSQLTFNPNPIEEPPQAEPIAVQVGDVDFLALREPLQINGTESSANIESFKGIPYAHSGDADSEPFSFGKPNRFQHSEVLPFSRLAESASGGGLLDATQFKSVCPQFNTTETTSETCLYLNIWRPENVQEGDDLPVYIYVHGGSFESGSGQLPHIIPDIAVAKSVMRETPFLAITFNYRLGLLGSLWLEDAGDTEGGNFGIGDQKRALQWVSRYIGLFGGDPQNITIIGQGAGATSGSILQQGSEQAQLSGDYLPEEIITRSILQSLPTGLSLQSYELAKDQYSTAIALIETHYPGQNLDNMSTSDLLDLQSKLKLELTGRLFGLPNGTIEQLASDVLQWQSDGDSLATIITKLTLNYGSLITSIEPRTKLMPFAPYLESHRECTREVLGICTKFEDFAGYHVTSQIRDYPLQVPSVVGFNDSDSNSYSSELKLTFLINIELVPGIKLLDVVLWIIGDSEDIRDLPNVPDIPAYTIISSILYFDMISNSPLNYDDFSPSSTPNTLAGVTEDVGKFNDLNNQLLFKCSVRDFVANIEHKYKPTIYHFSYEADFTNQLVGDNIFDVIGNLSCFGGKPCNQAELPFIFNKNVNINGNAISPSDTDMDLMNRMSSLWFSDELFSQYQYDPALDNVLRIYRENSDSAAIIDSINDWDAAVNSGIDSSTISGICDALYSDL